MTCAVVFDLHTFEGEPLELSEEGSLMKGQCCRLGRAKRGVQAGIAEKKISILERALEFHPGSDRLLMALLDAVSPTMLSEVSQLIMHSRGTVTDVHERHCPQSTI